MSSDTTDELKIGTGVFSATLSGERAIYIFILSACLAGLFYLLWKSQDISHVEHVTITDGIDEMVYVQSLSEEERKQLRITMPPSLRGKLATATPNGHP